MKRLLKYVEITTKITSVFPFFLTLAYLFYTKTAINPLKTAVFFASMFIFDLTATTINNYMDTKKNHQTLQFSRRTALAITIALFVISMSLGLYLVYLTDAVVLILGVICFLFGVIYSWGPVPISHQPYGEIFSGLFYGLFIPFILLYINSPEGTYFSWAWDSAKMSLSLEFNAVPIISALLLSVLPACLTANIMLANNTCDLEKDILVKRYTLPYYLGRKALLLFAGLYYMAYASVVLTVIFRMLSPLCLAIFLTIIPVQKNINRFFNKQVKEETFIASVQNFVIIISAQILLVFASAFI